MATQRSRLNLSKNFCSILARLGFILLMVGGESKTNAEPLQSLQYQNLRSVLKYFQAGNDQFNAKKYQEAIADYNQVVRLNPTISCVYLNRAYAHKAVGDSQATAADLKLFRQMSLVSDDTNFCIFLNRGHALNVPRITNNSFPNLLSGSQQSLVTGGSTSLVQDSKNQQAMAAYDEAVRLHPNDFKAYIDRGNARFEVKNYQAAIADYTKAISIQPNNAKGYANRGFAYKEIGDKPEAIADLRVAMRLFKSQGDMKAYQKVLEVFNSIH